MAYAVAPSKSDSSVESPTWFIASCLGLMLAAVVLAGWLPIGFSIATVFLFAGPHNWLEARYMLTRMPAKWGPLAGYFLLGLGGVLVLAAASWSLPWLAEWYAWEPATWLTALACWFSAIAAWVIALILYRSQQNPRRNWLWSLPVGLLAIAAIWLWPLYAGLALVYLHPCIAFWFLDRELGRLHSPWRTAYRWCLLGVPVCLGLLGYHLAAAPNLPGDDPLREAITAHAGGELLAGISTHCLVACHTFLEMLHYGVWVVSIPLLSVKQLPWQTAGIPLARRSATWQLVLQGVLLTGIVVMVVLWVGFLADYPVTRYVYFSLAIIHVLAEVPFLLRLL
jgi:hypothetical protein